MYIIKHTQKIEIKKGWDKDEKNNIFLLSLKKIIIMVFSETNAIEYTSFFKKILVYHCDTAIRRSSSNFSLFWYLVLMVVIAEKVTSERNVDPNGRSASLAELTKPWYSFFNPIHQLCKSFSWNCERQGTNSNMTCVEEWTLPEAMSFYPQGRCDLKIQPKPALTGWECPIPTIKRSEIYLSKKPRHITMARTVINQNPV